MRLIGRLFALLLVVFCFVVPASATRIVIQDPPGTPILRTPYPVTFTDSCSAYLPAGSPDANDMGCFAFSNNTGSDWSGLTLNLTEGSPSNQAFDCPTTGVNSTFAFARCSFDPTSGAGVLTFSDGLIPSGNGQTFVISEDDLPPSSLAFTLTPTLASATPEPSGLLLMATGLLSAGAARLTRRRVRG